MSIRCTLVVLLGAFSVATPSQSSGQVATVSVNVGSLGKSIPSDFDGFSIEVDDAANKYLGVANSPNLVFYQLLKNLGQATIRIGGNSTDYSCWNPSGAPHPSQCQFTITRDVLKGFFKGSAATGWPLILGVNLAQNSASWALEYGRQAVDTANATPGSKLLGFEFGNEPDLYDSEGIRPSGYSVQDLISDWRPYISAFKANHTTKAAPLAGPAYDDASSAWKDSRLGPFLNGVGASNLGIVTVHEYPTDTCGSDTVTIPQLLAESLMSDYRSRAAGWVSAVTSRGLALELGETNSTACAGKDGVDNVFAATLWGLDWLFTNFNVGMRRVNFHMDNAFYSAVFVTPTTNPDGTASYANVVAPLYYAMYTFSTHAQNKHVIPATINTSKNIKAYAVRSSSSGPVAVFVINKDSSAAGRVVITPSTHMGQASLLVVKAPSRNSKAVVYGGVTFDNNTGLLAGTPLATPVSPDSFGNYNVNLANSSIAVLSINP